MVTAAGQARPRLQALPGVRTLRSARFRLVIAAVLALLGLTANAAFLYVLSSQDVPWLEDFQAYYLAAERMVEGGSPYAAAQLDAAVDAACPGCYLYPPILAQVMAPLTAVSMEAAKFIWFGVVSLAGFLSVWIATGIRGARPTLERGLWCIVAVTFSYPAFQNGWLGNTSTLVALAVALVALGGVVAGLAAALGTLLKVSPGALLPIAFVADRRSRRSLIVSLAAVGLVFVALAPEAWLDYPAVLRNMLAGSAVVSWNLAPADQAAWLGAPDAVVGAIRAAAIGLGGAALAAGMWLARRPLGLPAAVVMATVAMLLIPGTLWYHYLAVLLPIAAMAWMWSGTAARLLLLLLLLAVNVGATTQPVLSFTASAGVMLVAAAALWPRDRRAGMDARGLLLGSYG